MQFVLCFLEEITYILCASNHLIQKKGIIATLWGYRIEQTLNSTWHIIFII